MSIDDNHYQVLRKIKTTKTLSQRKMATKLGFSLGKLNYCLKELKKRLIKIKNFQKIQINQIIYTSLHQRVFQFTQTYNKFHE